MTALTDGSKQARAPWMGDHAAKVLKKCGDDTTVIAAMAVRGGLAQPYLPPRAWNSCLPFWIAAHNSGAEPPASLTI